MTKNNFFLRLLSLGNLTILAVLAVIAFGVALVPMVNKFGLFQPTILIFFSAIIVSLGLIYLTNLNIGKKLHPILKTVAVILLFAAILAVQIVVARALLSDGYTWDANTLYVGAVQYVQTGAVDPGISAYLQVSSNNIPMFFILSGLFSSMNHFGQQDFLWGATLLNVALTFIAQVLIYKVIKMMFSRRVALVSLVFSFVLVGLNMHIQTPYTDTLTIIFPILLFYLGLHFVAAEHTVKKAILAGLIGFVAVIGFLIKPTVIIALIALVLTLILWGLANRKKFIKKKYLLKGTIVALTFAAVAAGTYLSYGFFVDRQHILPYGYAESNDHSLPPHHFANIGMKTKIDGYAVNYGGYDQDTAEIVSSLPSRDAKIAFSMSGIESQLGEYGALGYADFLAKKTSWIMSDATFFAYGEGDNNAVDFKNDDSLSTFIRDFMYFEGRHYLTFSNIMQVVWVSVLLFIALQLVISVLWKPARINPYITALHLMLFGILLFLLLFEGRSRYLLLYLPIFIVTAAYSLNWMHNTTKRKHPQTLADKE